MFLYLQVKNQLHNRLQELQPLPELLKNTELRLHDTEDKLMSSERNNTENKRIISELSAKVLLYSFENIVGGQENAVRIIFVAFVEDNASISSLWYFENYVSYFVQNRRK